MREKYSILVKKNPGDGWGDKGIIIETPSTLYFTVTSDEESIIKKILWTFGDDIKEKSFTNKGRVLNGFEMSQRIKKSHGNTFNLCATAIMDNDDIVIPDSIKIETYNIIIKERYVNPEVFRDQIVQFYKDGIFTNDVGESIYKIANRLAFANNFINYTYRDEMIGDAIVKMVEALSRHKFNPEVGNPFSYFTKIAFNAFCNRIKKEKKAREALVNYREDVYYDLVSKGILPYENSRDSDTDGESIIYEEGDIHAE